LAGQVCIDASFAIKWVLPEDLSEQATQLLIRWVEGGDSLVAPPLFAAEVTSVICERVFRGEMSMVQADAALDASLMWPVRMPASGRNLQRSALKLAARFNHPKAYDAQYLALAHLLGCELWTGDQRLVNSLQGTLPWVKWVGDFSQAS